MIKLKNVSKFYYKKGIIASGINKVNLELNNKEFVAIIGESGSGKSTLLNVISGLDTYEEGEMYINGLETSHFREKDFLNYRRQYIGNIFQTFNLINSYTVYQNIEVVLLLNGFNRKNIKNKVNELIKKVDLWRFRNTKASKLSGGQKQRVAIARVLAKETPIIIADEPTGNLDSKSAIGIIKLLKEISNDKLVIIVTHNYEQVEPYVTRKIKMHDGKILEDKTIKKMDGAEKIGEQEYRDITFFSKIRLGIRNTFNIVPKFLLLLLVFLFILLAVVSEYTGFKELEYQESINGRNHLFKDRSDKRIIIKKKDGSVISDEDYQRLSSLSNIDHIVKNDYIIDVEIFLTDNDKFYIYGVFQNIKNFNGTVDFGRMPENENEVIVMGPSYDYYISTMKEELLNANLYLGDNSTGIVDIGGKIIKVVGVKYIKGDNYNTTNTIYGSDVVERDISDTINKRFTTINILFENKYYESNNYNQYFQVIGTSYVPKNKVYISEDLSYYCKKYNCINHDLNIQINNLFYKDTLSLKVNKIYNKNNIKKLLGLKDYESNNGKVFINIDDYNNMYNRGNYQSSVYIKDVKLTNDTINLLHDNGYTTLLIKDTLVKYSSQEIMIIVRTIVTLILMIALFFISYFIIKIILKSRNVYFSTLRMLGASRSAIRDLIIIELFTIANIAYILVMIGVLLGNYKIINISSIQSILNYLSFSNYVAFYLILIFMAYLVSIRYSRNLFKNSAMSTYREEV